MPGPRRPAGPGSSASQLCAVGADAAEAVELLVVAGGDDPAVAEHVRAVGVDGPGDQAGRRVQARQVGCQVHQQLGRAAPSSLVQFGQQRAASGPAPPTRAGARGPCAMLAGDAVDLRAVAQQGAHGFQSPSVGGQLLHGVLALRRCRRSAVSGKLSHRSSSRAPMPVSVWSIVASRLPARWPVRSVRRTSRLRSVCRRWPCGRTGRIGRRLADVRQGGLLRLAPGTR